MGGVKLSVECVLLCKKWCAPQHAHRVLWNRPSTTQKLPPTSAARATSECMAGSAPNFEEGEESSLTLQRLMRV